MQTISHSLLIIHESNVLMFVCNAVPLVMRRFGLLDAERR